MDFALELDLFIIFIRDIPLGQSRFPLSILYENKPNLLSYYELSLSNLSDLRLAMMVNKLYVLAFCISTPLPDHGFNCSSINLIGWHLIPPPPGRSSLKQWYIVDII